MAYLYASLITLHRVAYFKYVYIYVCTFIPIFEVLLQLSKHRSILPILFSDMQRKYCVNLHGQSC